MSQRFYKNGRQVDADGLDLLTGGDPWALPHGCSWSSLETFIRSRKTYHRKHHLGTLSQPATPAMEFGSACHLAVLEPDRYGAGVVVAPKVDRRTKDGKAEWAAFLEESDGKTIVTQADHDKITAIRDSVWAHPVARALLEKPGILFEAETHWLDETGIEMFAHPDAIWPGGCLDFKTSRDVHPDKFASSVESYGYARQGAIYLGDAHREFFGDKGERFYHIAADTTEPHDVCVYEIDPEWLEAAWGEYRTAIYELAQCAKHDDWRSPGEKAGGAIELMRPPWAAAKALAYEMPEERWGE